MNGWDFLEQYKDLDIKQKAKIVIVMLTTSGNPADREKAEYIEEVTGFKTKPLTEEMLTELLDNYFFRQIKIFNNNYN
jgi:CheY-like chemotaxis protein